MAASGPVDSYARTDRRVLGHQEERNGEQRAANNAGHESLFMSWPPLWQGRRSWLELQATQPVSSCQRQSKGGILLMIRHDDHGHIIFSPSAQSLLDQVVAGSVGIAVRAGEYRCNG